MLTILLNRNGDFKSSFCDFKLICLKLLLHISWLLLAIILQSCLGSARHMLAVGIFQYYGIG
jgi:hypothetical protein